MSKTVAEEALEIVNGPRQATYGDAIDNMDRIARVWSGLLGYEILPDQAALMMVAVKLVRECGGGTRHRDNLVDAVGYLLIAERVLS